MGKIRKKFTPEFKMKIASEVVDGKLTHMEAVRKYQVCSSTLADWTNTLKGKPRSKVANPEQPFSHQPTAREKQLEKENLKLKEKLADLYMQVELLKKVESWKQQNKSASSSVITSSNWKQFRKGVK